MKGKRKLMLISPMLHQGGFERVCVTTARLMEPYFDITIVIFDSANIAYDVEGLNIIDIQMGVRKGKINKILNIIRRSRKVKELKKELQPDIAYSFGLTANIVNSFSKTGKEKVWLGLRSYADIEETLKIKLFVKLADLIICCSKEMEKELKHKFKYKKTTVLYNSYDVESIRKEAERKEPILPWGDYDEENRKIRTLVSMGRDDDLKCFWHMIKVFSLVHQKIPEARLILMGDGSFENYKGLAEGLKIRDEIHFAGMQREPYQYLKKGEVYLLTSSIEGFPNALIEGMALSLAPVSVNCMSGPAEILLEKGDTTFASEQFKILKDNKSIPVIYGEYGILVPVMDKEKDLDPEHITDEEKNMADIILDLMSDERKLQKYRLAAAKRAQIFTYESYVEQFLSLTAMD